MAPMLYALSIKPEFAKLIVSGAKRIENRSWRTKYRGPLVIHAAKPAGAFIGVVDLIDCVALAEVEGKPYATGPWCWILKNPRAIKPIPYRGRQKLFPLPERIADNVGDLTRLPIAH